MLLRQGPQGPSPAPRARFLDRHDVGAIRAGAADEQVWRAVGRAHARVHAVRFPSPLCGPFGPGGSG